MRYRQLLVGVLVFSGLLGLPLSYASTVYDPAAADRVLADMKASVHDNSAQYRSLLAGQIALPTFRLLAASSSMTNSSTPDPEAVCGDAFKTFVKSGNSFNVGEDLTAEQSTLAAACGIDLIATYHLGAVLVDANFTPFYASPSFNNWKFLSDLAKHYNQQISIKGQPLTLLLGTDAIHGNQHTAGSVIYPQNMGLGMTHDTQLVEQVAKASAAATLANGYNWVYMPTVAVVHDYRWGRSDESFSQDPAEVKAMAKAYVAGLQQMDKGEITGVLATAKHFVGDGDTLYGHDEGISQTHGRDLASYWQDNGLGYEGAIDADVGSVMASYNAIDDDRMHFGGKWNMLYQFSRGDGIPSKSFDETSVKFPGFVVSDYVGPTRAGYFYAHNGDGVTQYTLFDGYKKALDHGVDMLMLGCVNTKAPLTPLADPSDRYYQTLGPVMDAIDQIGQQDIDLLETAARQIIAVKLAMAPAPSRVLSTEKQQALALKVAEESMVLLKNNHQKIPLNNDQIKQVVLLGQASFDPQHPLYDNIGVQNGGWTITWQGQSGSEYFENTKSATNPTGAAWGTSSGATTVLQGIQHNARNAKLLIGPKQARQVKKKDADKTVAIVVVGEMPLTEYMGDIANPDEIDPWYRIGATYQATRVDCHGSDCTQAVDVQSQYAPHVTAQHNLPEQSEYTFHYHGGSYRAKAYPQRDQLFFNYTKEDLKAIRALKAKGVSVITVVLSSRPVILSHGEFSPWDESDAVVAAFLPGTLGGQAIANGIWGKYHFGEVDGANQLSFVWPRDMHGVFNLNDTGNSGIAYPVGFGLTTGEGK